MAGKIVDVLRFTFTESSSKEDRDLASPQAVAAARSQTEALENALMAFNDAVSVDEKGKGGLHAGTEVHRDSTEWYIPLISPAPTKQDDITNRLQQDYAGRKEAGIRAEFWTGSLSGKILGHIDVTPQNVNRLVEALNTTAQEAERYKMDFGDLRRLTPAKLHEAEIEVEVKARQVLGHKLRDIIKER